MVYYLPSGAGKGTWYPRLPEPQVRDMRPLPSVELKQEGVMEDFTGGTGHGCGTVKP